MASTEKIDIDALPDFDIADYLTTPDRQADYLSLVMEDGNDAEIRHALNVIARARGMSGIAETANLNRQSLYAALGENGNPAFSTVVKVIRAMGMTLSAHSTPKPKTSA